MRCPHFHTYPRSLGSQYEGVGQSTCTSSGPPSMNGAPSFGASAAVASMGPISGPSRPVRAPQATNSAATASEPKARPGTRGRRTRES